MAQKFSPTQQRRDARMSGLGWYAQDPLPVDPVLTRLKEWLASLKGPPGVRLAATNDPSSRYFGTDLIPAILTPESVHSKVNQPGDLELALLQAETYGPGVPM